MAYSREEILNIIDDWSENSHEGMSSGEEEHLDRELEESNDDLR